MKRYRLLLMLLAAMVLWTPPAAAAVNNQYFRADKQYYDFENGVYVVQGNIVITVENGSISGEKALVKLSTLEFWGSGGWVLKQYDVTFKGDSAYVKFFSDTALIEGGADFQRTGLQILSDKVDYNWKTKVAVFKGNVRAKTDENSWTADTISYNVETKQFL